MGTTAVRGPGLRALQWHLPPRHQAPERSHRPDQADAQSLRLRQRQNARAGPAQHRVHLLALLQSARTHLGAEQYTTGIDIWSAGCVISECVLRSPLFAGSTMIEQLGEIMKVLGTP